MCSCETSFGSIFLFEIGASVDGAPVVVDSTWPRFSSRRFPTVWAALSDHFRPGYNTVVVRVGGTCSRLPESAAPSQMQCVVGVFTYQGRASHAPAWCIFYH